MSQSAHVAATGAALVLMMLLGVTSSPAVALAQEHDARTVLRRSAHRCTNAMAAGTFGYRMNGVIVGVGPFLVNGIFTHEPNGTMHADVQLVIGNQTIPVLGSGGMFKTNPDCTGSGEFDAPPLPHVTYEFVLTDGGDQIELLNTNAGVVLHGISRRISKAGREPRCRNSQILGTYGYRLEGSVLGASGAPNIAAAGLVTHSMDRPDDDSGVLTGHDTLSVMGEYLPRTFDGAFTVEPNCRGSARYTDSLGNTVNVVFTVVNDGDTLFVQSNDPGVAIHGVAQRVR